MRQKGVVCFVLVLSILAMQVMAQPGFCDFNNYSLVNLLLAKESV